MICKKIKPFFVAVYAIFSGVSYNVLRDIIIYSDADANDILLRNTNRLLATIMSVVVIININALSNCNLFCRGGIIMKRNVLIRIALLTVLSMAYVVLMVLACKQINQIADKVLVVVASSVFFVPNMLVLSRFFASKLDR